MEKTTNHGTSVSNFDFAFNGGSKMDMFLGMYDTPARELHPVQGRWIQPDPAGLAAVDPSNPQTWNRYAYVENNPVSFVDPLGLDDCEGSGECLTSGSNGGGPYGGPWMPGGGPTNPGFCQPQYSYCGDDPWGGIAE